VNARHDFVHSAFFRNGHACAAALLAVAQEERPRYGLSFRNRYVRRLFGKPIDGIDLEIDGGIQLV
jgi:hypothetical protein